MSMGLTIVTETLSDWSTFYIVPFYPIVYGTLLCCFVSGVKTFVSYLLYDRSTFSSKVLPGSPRHFTYKRTLHSQVPFFSVLLI